MTDLDGLIAAQFRDGADPTALVYSDAAMQKEVKAKLAERAEEDARKDAYLRSWQPVDLSDVLDGTWQPLQPTVGLRTDGVGVFYPGKSHTVSG
jgi:hypothetical protein